MGFGWNRRKVLGRSLADGMFYQTLTQVSAIRRTEFSLVHMAHESSLQSAIGSFFSSMAAHWNTNEDWEISGEELWVSDGTELGTQNG